MKPPYAIGSVPSLSGHEIAYRWRSLPRVRRHRASKPQGSSERVLPWQITMDQLIFTSLSHTHYWYEVGMLKVPAVCRVEYVTSFIMVSLKPRPFVQSSFDMQAPRYDRHTCFLFSFCLFGTPLFPSILFYFILPPFPLLFVVWRVRRTVFPSGSCFSGFSTFDTTTPVLSTCPFHTNSGCGKQRRISIGPW